MKRVAVLFGGRSGEHEVSLQSAASVLAALDPRRYQAVPVGICRDGRWLLPADVERALREGPDAVGGRPVVVRPGAGLATGDDGARLEVDAVFPVLHGPNGEDGTVQGLLELTLLPYVGAGVLGSSAAMDKLAMKEIFVQGGLPTVAWVRVLRRDWERSPQGELGRVEAALRYPVFTKPANMGSSVGVRKCRGRDELRAGLDLAAAYDRRLIVEQGVEARELECSVLGNDDPVASLPGEIIPEREFYDYEAKYLEETTHLVIPAQVPAETVGEVQRLAVAAFQALDCAGLARVDFFLERGSQRVLVNELNTIPGFTRISMYPKLWEASGLAYRDLVGRLVELALERAAERQRNQISREGADRGTTPSD